MRLSAGETMLIDTQCIQNIHSRIQLAELFDDTHCIFSIVLLQNIIFIHFRIACLIAKIMHKCKFSEHCPRHNRYMFCFFPESHDTGKPLIESLCRRWFEEKTSLPEVPAPFLPAPPLLPVLHTGMPSIVSIFSFVKPSISAVFSPKLCQCLFSSVIFVPERSRNAPLVDHFMVKPVCQRHLH